MKSNLMKIKTVHHNIFKPFYLFTVLNFFPVPVDDECLSDDGRRSGVCLNVYECRMQGGSSRGQCALGFGVCCVCKYL